MQVATFATICMFWYFVVTLIIFCLLLKRQLLVQSQEKRHWKSFESPKKRLILNSVYFTEYLEITDFLWKLVNLKLIDILKLFHILQHPKGPNNAEQHLLTNVFKFFKQLSKRFFFNFQANWIWQLTIKISLTTVF